MPKLTANAGSHAASSSQSYEDNTHLQALQIKLKEYNSIFYSLTEEVLQGKKNRVKAIEAVPRNICIMGAHVKDLSRKDSNRGRETATSCLLLLSTPFYQSELGKQKTLEVGQALGGLYLAVGEIDRSQQILAQFTLYHMSWQDCFELGQQYSMKNKHNQALTYLEEALVKLPQKSDKKVYICLLQFLNMSYGELVEQSDDQKMVERFLFITHKLAQLGKIDAKGQLANWYFEQGDVRLAKKYAQEIVDDCSSLSTEEADNPHALVLRQKNIVQMHSLLGKIYSMQESKDEITYQKVIKHHQFVVNDRKLDLEQPKQFDSFSWALQQVIRLGAGYFAYGIDKMKKAVHQDAHALYQQACECFFQAENYLERIKNNPRGVNLVHNEIANHRTLIAKYLANMCFFGWGMKVDHVRAQHYFEETLTEIGRMFALNAGVLHETLHNAGFFYSSKIAATEVDLEKAESLYLEAANDGFRDSAIALVIFYVRHAMLDKALLWLDYLEAQQDPIIKVFLEIELSGNDDPQLNVLRERLTIILPQADKLENRSPPEALDENVLEQPLAPVLDNEPFTQTAALSHFQEQCQISSPLTVDKIKSLRRHRKQKHEEMATHVKPATLGRDAFNVMEDIWNKKQKVRFGDMLTLFADPFFNGQVQIKGTKSGYMFKPTIAGMESEIVSTHRIHPRDGGFDPGFLHKLSQMLETVFGLKKLNP